MLFISSSLSIKPSTSPTEKAARCSQALLPWRSRLPGGGQAAVPCSPAPHPPGRQKDHCLPSCFPTTPETTGQASRAAAQAASQPCSSHLAGPSASPQGPLLWPRPCPVGGNFPHGYKFSSHLEHLLSHKGITEAAFLIAPPPLSPCVTK